MRKQEYIIPENTIYMCGHSLGPCSKNATKKVSEALTDWGQYGVAAWNKSEWFDISARIGTKIAKLIGASSDEVVVSDSTSVNLFKVLTSACKLNSTREIILTEMSNFPTNLYIAQGVTRYCEGKKVKYVKPENILKSMDKNTAVLMLTHVNYRTSFVFDMDEITKKAHDLGIMVIWDLSHSIGIMPLDLKACKVDFAVGCTYKYVSGGPGAPSFIYVNKSHHEMAYSPITGWMGHQFPFEFSEKFSPINNAAKYNVGTPYIFSLKALEGALEIFEGLDMCHLQRKSLMYSKYLMKGVKENELELMCESPSKNSLRGGHVAFSHEKAFSISRALILKGVICDYRAPGLIRLSVNPLYLSQTEIEICISVLFEIMKDKIYLQDKYKYEYQYQVKVT